MTLATRCASCGTSFRVVQDQLRVSDGWVRCGRCDAVFDAMQSLIDLDLPDAAATETRAPPTSRERPIEPLPVEVQRPPIDIHRLLERQHQDDDALDREPSFSAPDDLDAAAGGSPSDTTGGETRTAAVAVAEVHPGDNLPASRTPPAAPRGSIAPPLASTAPLKAPTFMRDADRQARWNSPAMRAALLGSSLILLLMLLLQITYHRRDSIAASSPTAAAWLHSACERWNCRIEPLRRVGELSIDSSALSKVSGQPQAVRLTMTLRNRSAIDMALPAVELSLTDAQGQLIARRALLPADFQIDPPIVPGSAALALQLVLSTSERRVAGYTVELFYP